jgi:hypothetical protein
VAQLVAQATCNRQVIGSNPITGSHTRWSTACGLRVGRSSTGIDSLMNDRSCAGACAVPGAYVLVSSRSNRQTENMGTLKHSESMAIARSPEDLYDLVSDITRMGKWSPVCRACWWDEGAGPEVGAWFTGRNELPERTWETRSEVVAADRGHEFAFIVNGSWTRWGYVFAPVAGGTMLTESWEFLPGGVAMFEERFGADSQAQIANRLELARKGIPATLAAIKKDAESG